MFIDADLDLPPVPPVHMEYVVQADQLVDASSVKPRVYRILDTLDGWCSKKKAGILMDLVLLTQPLVAVEIGVFGGKSLVPIAYAMKANRKGKIYGIDPWQSMDSIDGMDGEHRDWWGSLDHEKIFQKLCSKIRANGLDDQIQLIRSTSEDAELIPEIDLLHIDGNHSERASYYDVTKWGPLVKEGGIIIFDDITWGTTSLAVEWLNENCIKFLEVRDDNNVWGIWIRL